MNCTVRLSLTSLAIAIALSTTATAQVGIEHQKLMANDASSGDAFGHSSALDGDTLVVGADKENNEGAAYVYTRGTNGVWTQLQKLTASGNGPGYEFGHCCAISGDWIAVGSRLEDEIQPDAGAIYMFKKGTGGTYSEMQVIRPNDFVAYDHFGTEVEMDGNRMVVASPRDDDDGKNSGSAYVFERTGDTWNQTAKLKASNAVAWDLFPHKISLDGDRIAFTSVAWNNLKGIAYVFDYNGSTWSETQILTASDGVAGDEYGTSIALDGNWILIGARLVNDKGTFAGSEYAYKFNGSTWNETQEFYATDTVQHDHFGWATALDGNRAVVSANRANPQGIATAGKSYVFELNNVDTWVQIAQIEVTDPQSGDFQGWASDIDGHRVLITTPGDNQGGSDAGAAYVAESDFLRSRDTISVASGGTINFYINFGYAQGGEEVWSLGSFTGIFPGTALGVQAPLNWDLYFRLLLTQPNLSAFSGARGTLDNKGAHTFSLTAPGGLGNNIVGLELYHAALIFDSGTFTATTMPASFEFVN